MAIKEVISNVPGSRSGASYRITMESLDTQFPSTLKLPYNPESLSVKLSPNWAPVNGIAAVVDRSQWVNNGPKTIGYTHIIQAKDVVKNIGGNLTTDLSKYTQIESVLNQLESWATEPQQETGEPTRLLFTMGLSRQMVCTIKDFSFRTLIVGSDGLITTAEYDILLEENTDG